MKDCYVEMDPFGSFLRIIYFFKFDISIDRQVRI